jgi:alanine racemase
MRATRIIIHTDNLRHNIRTIRQSKPSQMIMPVIKANAYGHGMVECAKIFEQEKVAMLAVAFLEEAIQLRKADVTIPILVLTPLFAHQIGEFFEWNIECIIDSEENLNLIAEYIRTRAKNHSSMEPLRSHLCIDTGMKREGIYADKLSSVLQTIKGISHLNVHGVFSHFATSGSEVLEHQEFLRKQSLEFAKVLEQAKNLGFVFKYVHIANSGGIRSVPEMVQNLCTMMRSGIALYGYGKTKQRNIAWDLRPVLELHSRICALRTVHKGESVGYGREFVARETTTIATIPIGYGDGWSRILSGHQKKGECLIGGKRFPIVGAICMDELMVNIGSNTSTHFSQPHKVGDKVVFIGKQDDEEITIEDIAEKTDTIPYEITTRLAERVPRIYY